MLDRRYILDTGSLLSGNAVLAVTGLVQGIVVARVLGAEAFGVIGLITAFSALVFGLFNARTSNASIRYTAVAIETNQTDQLLPLFRLIAVVGVGLSITAAIAITGFAEPISTFLIPNVNSGKTLIILAAAVFTTNVATAMLGGILSALQCFRQIAVAGGITGISRMTIVVALLTFNASIHTYFIALLAASIIAIILSLFFAWHSLRQGFGINVLSVGGFPIDGKREILKFILITNYVEILGVGSKQLDTLVLGQFRPDAEVGYYRLARTLANSVGNLVTPLQSVLHTRMARTAVSSTPAVALSYAHGAWKSIGLPLGILVSIIVLAFGWLIPPVFGGDFTDAVIPTQILVISAAVWLSFFWLRPLYLAINAEARWALAMSIIIPVLIVGYFLVIPLFGVIGLAVWLAMMQVLGHGGFYLYLRYRWIGHHRSVSVSRL